ncbi:RDD family protein [Nocardiopsis sp. CNR-923]|uniref:RDD family protein n=1 Tax=Nocardiopsis sp. CNR-923 TaxID=1904965 RepID=UPI00096AB320|nr:RDD family protein [Nocardiopsis sp. CNR-923]
MATPHWYPQNPRYAAAVPSARGGPELAGFGRRLAARSIDYVLAVIAAAAFFVVVVVLLLLLTGESDASDAQAGVWALMLFFGWGVLLFFYDWLYLVAWGRTLGKAMVGIRVVNAADGGRLSQGQALGRAALFGLPQSLPVLGHLFSLGESMASLGEARRALHDRTCGTVVVRD